jgi:hypothetical protein
LLNITILKKLFSISLIFFAGLLSVHAQENGKKLTLTFVNNSILPKKYTFVSYRPGKDSNETEGKFLAPYGKKTFTDVVGTQIYIASTKEISIVMSGKRIMSKPFWVLKPSDNNKTVNLNL